MTDVPENVEEIARKTWGMAQRVGMQIAGLPQDQCEAALVKAEQSLTRTYTEFGATGPQLEGFVKLQAIKHFVTEIEASGTPQGGNA